MFVDTSFFHKPNGWGSLKEIWIGITALVCQYNTEEGYFVLADENGQKELMIESDVYESSEGKAMISRLSVGETYRLINLRYTPSSGKLTVTLNSYIQHSSDQELFNELAIPITINTINGHQLMGYGDNTMVFDRITPLHLCTIGDTRYTQDGTTIFRKLRFSDCYRSDIWLTVWGSDVNLVEELGLTPGSWVSLRNFRTNLYQKSMGMSFVQGRTYLVKLDEDTVDPLIKGSLNQDWETRRSKPLVVVGKVVAIEEVHSYKKCVGKGNIVGCKQTCPYDQKKCNSAPCKGNDFGVRTLVPDYRLKLVVIDENNKKMTITAFKKNIESVADRTIPFRVNGGTMNVNGHVYDQYAWMLNLPCKITFWLKSSTARGTDVKVEGGKQEPIFIGYERVMDEGGAVAAAAAALADVDAAADADSVPPPPKRCRNTDIPNLTEEEEKSLMLWKEKKPDLTEEEAKMLMQQKKMTLTLLDEEEEEEYYMPA